MCALFAILTALGAQMRIPFPVVPLTLQTLMVILSGLLLGPSGGLVSQVVYLFMGLVGLPVFTGGGGVHYVFHPTFGFLVGFVPAAWIAGHLARKKRSAGFWGYVPACVAATLVIYLCGISVLYLNLNFVAGKSVTFLQVVRIGMIPFIPGDMVKTAAASLLAAKIVPVLLSSGIIVPHESSGN